MPHPVKDIEMEFGSGFLAVVNDALRIQATGSRNTVRRQLGDLVERYRPDELILTGQIHDHTRRRRSFEIAAETLKNMQAGEAA